MFAAIEENIWKPLTKLAHFTLSDEDSGPPKMIKVTKTWTRVRTIPAPVSTSTIQDKMPKPEIQKKKKRVRQPPTHPPMSSLVNEAIEDLHERGGSSLQSIKKFIANNHHLDTQKLGPYIRKYLRDAVDKGTLLHPKGHGATGHFKLAKGHAPGGHHPVHPQAKKKVTNLKKKRPSSRPKSTTTTQKGKKRTTGRPKMKKAKAGGVKIRTKPVKMMASNRPMAANMTKTTTTNRMSTGGKRRDKD